MRIIDGNTISEEILNELKAKVKSFTDTKPSVLFIRVGEDPASISYVRKKQKIAEKIGIVSRLLVLPDSISQGDLIREISQANSDDSIHGILVQAPLPHQMDEREVFNSVNPLKDVDGFNATNLGKLCQEVEDGFISCTPAGILELLKRSRIETGGKHVVILGRSLIVGKPAGMLMLRKGFPGNSTVTFCHSRTSNLPDLTRRADILIAAIGKPNFVEPEMVSDGVSVIDVGINRIPDSKKIRISFSWRCRF